MLLSFPNWIIHIFSALEWGVALAMLYRYGKLIGRKDVRRFALFMIPHWIGSWFVLAYHLSVDSIPFLLDMSEAINLVGSIALLYAAIRILKGPEKQGAAVMGALVLGSTAFTGHPQSYLGNNVFDAILQVSSVVYMSFLVLLLKIRKKEPELFSGLMVGGFWFVLVFISVTVFCIYLSTEVRGYPTLSHDDLLHALAESLLSISNLMIVLGIHRQTRQAENRLMKTQGLSSAR